jgi:hypothetical protein
MKRLERLRWLGVPIAAYLLIALVLPLANGAASRSDFAHHAAAVLLGCALVVGAIAAIGGGVELVVAGARRVANNRSERRVKLSGENR